MNSIRFWTIQKECVRIEYIKLHAVVLKYMLNPMYEYAYTYLIYKYKKNICAR